MGNKGWLWALLGLAALLFVCVGCGLVVGLLVWPEPTPPVAVNTAPLPTTPPQPTATPHARSTPSTGPTPQASRRVPFRAVVQIVALDAQGDPAWSGSGTIISPDGLILTNAHIVEPFAPDEPAIDRLLILMTDREDEPPRPRYFAQVVQVDEDLDLAVVRITHDLDDNPVDPDALHLPFVPLGSAQDLRLGDELIILGYPGIGGDTITLSKGVVAGFTEEEPYGPRAFIKTTATLAGGNSGGAALNARGELVAIPTQVGAGTDEAEVVDCRVLVDTNGDGVVDDNDTCVPIGGFINALRPVDLARPLVEAARQGAVARPSPKPPAEADRTGGLDDIWQHPGPVLDQDTFDAPVEGWEGDDEDTRITYADGAMRVLLRTPFVLHALTSPVAQADVVVWARVRITQPAGDGEVGLACRYRDLDNFYAASVIENGHFYVWKYEDGEYAELHPEAPLPVAAHFDPAGWNEIGLVCYGPHLALWVNDQPVVTVFDRASARIQGGAGLVVATYQHPNFEVAFDAFRIHRAQR